MKAKIFLFLAALLVLGSGVQAQTSNKALNTNTGEKEYHLKSSQQPKLIEMAPRHEHDNNSCLSCRTLEDGLTTVSTNADGTAYIKCSGHSGTYPRCTCCQYCPKRDCIILTAADGKAD